MKHLDSRPDLLVFSHLRWDFVFQRPQHLMTRYVQDRRVFFVEEPIFSDAHDNSLVVSERAGGVKLVVPHLTRDLERQGPDAIHEELEKLVTRFVYREGIALNDYTIWYYTPMALLFTRNLVPTTVIYDCMDQLSAFRGAPAGLVALESELLKRADLVFTGGHSLYAEKKDQHSNIHAMPSSIDRAHFGKARARPSAPKDQALVPGPRLGFFGVVDERFDTELLRACAELRPEWNFMILGPVVKIDPAELPHLPNIHYLGMKDYLELPNYLAGWDVAMLPFARNESTRFISPTKTPEYLAAGCPVVSTSIRDVVEPYGAEGLVKIADEPEDFIRAAESLMNMGAERHFWLNRVDSFLSSMCWSKTQARMSALENAVRGTKTQRPYAAAGVPLASPVLAHDVKA